MIGGGGGLVWKDSLMLRRKDGHRVGITVQVGAWASCELVIQGGLRVCCWKVRGDSQRWSELSLLTSAYSIPQSLGHPGPLTRPTWREGERETR